jgi:hypothetical protein
MSVFMSTSDPEKIVSYAGREGARIANVEEPNGKYSREEIVGFLHWYKGDDAVLTAASHETREAAYEAAWGAYRAGQPLATLG